MRKAVTFQIGNSQIHKRIGFFSLELMKYGKDFFLEMLITKVVIIMRYNEMGKLNELFVVCVPSAIVADEAQKTIYHPPNRSRCLYVQAGNHFRRISPTNTDGFTLEKQRRERQRMVKCHAAAVQAKAGRVDAKWSRI